jgi:hypothetical protein
MKRLLFIGFLFSCFTASAQDCIKQENVPAQYVDEEIVITTPAIKVVTVPAVIDTVHQKICIKETAYEEYQVCDSLGIITKCTREIPAQYTDVTFYVERIPAQYVEYGGTVERIKVKKLKRNGYIRIVSCSN